jgi:serine/threonine protein kinase
MEVKRRIDDYELGRMLDKGHYGHVRLATMNGKQYAVKYMKKNNEQSNYYTDYFLAKESMIKDFRHKNILRIYAANNNGIYIKETKESQYKINVTYIVLQYASNGNLFEFIASSNGFTEKTARYYFDHIADAIRYLHSRGVAHRDLKLENILLDEDFNPLICDFGLSRKLSEVGFVTNDAMNKMGTENCMSPELLAGREHSPVKDDVFALGHILFMMVARHQPFHRALPDDPYYRHIRRSQFNEYWNEIGKQHSPGWCTKEFKSLVTAMLNCEMVFRPSLTEIEEHSWMKNFRSYTSKELRIVIENSLKKTLIEQEKEARKRKKSKLEEVRKLEEEKLSLKIEEMQKVDKGIKMHKKNTKVNLKKYAPKKLIAQKKFKVSDNPLEISEDFQSFSRELLRDEVLNKFYEASEKEELREDLEEVEKASEKKLAKNKVTSENFQWKEVSKGKGIAIEEDKEMYEPKEVYFGRGVPEERLVNKKASEERIIRKPQRKFKKIERLKPTMLLTKEDIDIIESILTKFFDPKSNELIEFTEEGKNLIASIRYVKKDEEKNKVMLTIIGSI